MGSFCSSVPVRRPCRPDRSVRLAHLLATPVIAQQVARHLKQKRPGLLDLGPVAVVQPLGEHILGHVCRVAGVVCALAQEIQNIGIKPAKGIGRQRVGLGRDMDILLDEARRRKSRMISRIIIICHVGDARSVIEQWLNRARRVFTVRQLCGSNRQEQRPCPDGTS